MNFKLQNSVSVISEVGNQGVYLGIGCQSFFGKFGVKAKVMEDKTIQIG